jgi:hypothetical protein
LPSFLSVLPHNFLSTVWVRLLTNFHHYSILHTDKAK